MTPKWQKLASLAQEICTLRFQFFGSVFASKGYPFKNIFSQLSVKMSMSYAVASPRTRSILGSILWMLRCRILR